MLASMCLFLVIVGIVMYYLNSRLKRIESSVAQQNIMMSDVVASIRKDVFEQEVEVDDDDEVEGGDDEVFESESVRLYVSDGSAEESDTENESDTDQNEKIKEMPSQETPIYKNMKVDELRRLIQESDMAPNDSVSKLKKQELIDILTN